MTTARRLAALLVLPVALAAGPAPAPAGAAAPAVSVTPVSPATATDPFVSGESVTVAVGPNGLFGPGSRINVLECADPGGSAAGLPTDISGCDGTTVEGTTVLVGADGSFQVPYTIWSLPNAALGEQPNWLPVCNQSNPCVLYVGQNQEDFTQPKVFSAPFTVAPSGPGGSPAPGGTTPPPPGGGTAGTATGGGAGAVGGGGSGAPGPGGGTGDPVALRSRAPGSLAQTGLPALVTLGGLLGLVLALIGLALTRATRARRAS